MLWNATKCATAVTDQGGRGAATASRSPTGQLGEQGQRLGWQPSATGTYQQKELLFRERGGEGGTRNEAEQARIPRSGTLMEHKPHRQHAEMEQEHFSPTGKQGMEPPAPSSCGAAEPLAAIDILPTGQPKLRRFNIRSKRIQTGKDVLHPLKSVACFFLLFKWALFFSSLFQTKPD